jgi:2-succinyl-5-enolpyruvyl-6-hydroxy-3-cyclohexene-1-carboxylate synthase
MAGNSIQNKNDSGSTQFMTINSQLPIQMLEIGNRQLATQVLEEVISQGVSEFCLCPSTRNAPLVYPLVYSSQVRIYNWPEERSAAFFALGRIKATGRPVAVVTTSGTAAAELLPAAMEAHYTGLPLILMTADRPRRFRGKGAPQSAEQVGLFSWYAHEVQDLAEGDECQLSNWTRQGPLHLNLCFEEPNDHDCHSIRLNFCEVAEPPIRQPDCCFEESYLAFLKQTRFPFVIVGALPPSRHEAVIRFLLHLKAPVYLEGISGIREDPRLASLRITRIEQIWSVSAHQGYPIDGILRLGGVPTVRLWRDLEYKERQISVCSVSEQPFSGLSCADVITTSLSSFCTWAQTIKSSLNQSDLKWKEVDRAAQHALLALFEEEPQAEASLIHALSSKIPTGSKVYLGNSLPIREWDQAATYEPRGFQMACNRGVNGIDGQIATFLGFSSPEQDNWSILGDLTVLYDLVAPWVSSQLPETSINLVLVNNGGGAIFKNMFAHRAFQNSHHLHFEPFANFWGWQYERWESIPSMISQSQGPRLIELVPNAEATERFWQRLKEI